MQEQKADSHPENGTEDPVHNRPGAISPASPDEEQNSVSASMWRTRKQKTVVKPGREERKQTRPMHNLAGGNAAERSKARLILRGIN